MLADCDVVSIIPIQDAQLSREFYESTLGLELIADNGFALVFDVNGRVLRLTLVQELAPQPFSIIGWEVPDIEATVSGLAGQGVVFERYPGMEQDELGIWTTPDGSARVAWFKDPDGNVLSVVES